MNELMELLSSLGLAPLIAAGGGAAILAFFVMKKGKKTKKSSGGVGGGYDYGDSTTSGYDTKAGNFVDELNSDSVLTQDVQDFAVPNFDKDELERSTVTKGYKKKSFNSSLPGMTLGDTRPMVPNFDDELELRSEIKEVKASGFGLKPKMSALDIATLTNSNLKILSDEEQLMRPASPEKYSADSPVQSINVPAHMQIANVDNGNSLNPIGDTEKGFDANFELPDFPSFQEDKKEIVLSFDGFPKINSQDNDSVLEFHEPEVKKETSPSDGLSFFSMDTAEKPKELDESEIDISDIPGLNLAAVDEVAHQTYKEPLSLLETKEKEPELSLVEDTPVVEEYFMTINTRLNESEHPETIAYHQEINTALFLDDEGMKDQALQTLQNTVELVKNVKVKFYFKLAIQSYVNSNKDKALPDIMKNFYDFEFEKYSK